MEEVSTSLFSHPEREKLFALNAYSYSLKNENLRLQQETATTIARKDQFIEQLSSEKLILEYKNASLITAVELLERELKKTRLALSDSQQEYITLTMQYTDFKGEVDTQIGKVEEAVKSKMGFIPKNILKSVNKVKKLKVDN